MFQTVICRQKTLPVSIFIIIFLLIAPLVKGENGIEEFNGEILESMEEVTEYDYPGSGAVILKNEIETDFTVLPYQIKVTTLIKIFNGKGAEDFSELRVYYNQSREEVNILEARILRPGNEGEPLEIISKDSITEIPEKLEENGIKSEFRFKTVRFQPLKKGDIISYSYVKIIKEPPLKEGFALKKYLQFFEPIKKMDLIIKVSTNRPFFYKTNNIKVEPIISNKEEERIYHWQLSNLPPLVEEPALPPPDYFVPYIVVSSFSNWFEICDWYNNMYAYGKEGDPVLKELVRELVKDEYGILQRIKTLYNYVAFEISYVGLELWNDRDIPRPLSEVYTSKFGSSVDKSHLLIALLKEIGIKAEPVLINIKGQTKEGMIMPGDLSHMIVYIPEYYLYLDPSFDSVMFGSLPYFSQGKKALHPLSYTLSSTPTGFPRENLEIYKQKVSPGEDYSAVIKLEWKTRGFFDMLRKNLFREYLPQQRELLLKQLVNRGFDSSQVVLDSIKGVDSLEEYFSIISTLNIPNYVQEMEGKFFIRPFRLPLRLKELFNSAERVNPLYFNTPQTIVQEVEIEIPDGYQLFYLPGDVEYNTQPGSLEASFKDDGSKVITKFELVVKNKLITPEEYLLFRKLLEKVEDVYKKQIVLIREGPE